MANDYLTHRQLTWDACHNVRDLGGLPTADGRQTRYGSIIRADLLRRLTPAGQQALRDYGVRTIIDLRTPEEVAAEPDTLSDNTPGAPTYLNIPLDQKLPQTEAILQQPLTHAQIYNIYLDHYPHAVAAVMRAIANAPEGAVVFHCHSGKDRTGIIAALLLRLAGVPKAIVAEDYALSRTCLWPLYVQIVAQAGGEEQIDPWLKPLSTPETMHDMLNHIETNYNSVHDYLINAAGLSTEEITKLRQRLLADV